MEGMQKQKISILFSLTMIDLHLMALPLYGLK